ncbi:hypothetical protein [Legionella longbeachae]|uniref:Uncharacterized protein n=1 Tax=Legionella longbeachae serogroup 1 (strain NSW150) TaxID=661367 RepID=D3HRU0_LEGLN|nr:hypothetical protein [Legionella longbeachae]VEE02123.1 Uncharacterised protein [Legionella oakridgensis]HBD7396632.1 hypothetical protein [Legionella pneumophila]ARB91575.1 hypothetical protein A6J40_05010 [Legionella longbeachae]ARM35279.1 hypothetical protein B0B39_17960 [Legionella longbeachae]EEZ95259.1 hypothetical protein LLB_0430 [Legionella longbeachae D-4968]
MLGLAVLDDLSYVLDSSNDLPDDFCFSGELRRCIVTYNKRPGFFKPYQNAKEFADGVIAPVVYPLGLAFLGTMGSLVTAIAPSICVGSLLFAVGAAAFGASEVNDNALDVAALSLYITGYALVLTAASFLLAIITIPCSLASLVTHTLSTVGSQLMDYMDDNITTENKNAIF